MYTCKELSATITDPNVNGGARTVGGHFGLQLEGRDTTMLALVARDVLRYEIEGQGTLSLGDADGFWNRHGQNDEYGDLGTLVTSIAEVGLIDRLIIGKVVQNQSGMGVKALKER